jgi:hypothetical protein
MNDDIIKTNFNECINLANNIPRDEWNKIIRKCFGDKTIINWKDDLVSQLDFGSDVLITTNKGRKYSIDVKTRNKDYLYYSDWLFEIAHHRYSNETRIEKIETTSGWLYKSTSDLILFATIVNDKLMEAICFSLVPFKNDNFSNFISNLEIGWASTYFDNGIYQLTLNKKASLDFIKEHANFFWYWRELND